MFTIPPIDPYHIDHIEALHSGGSSNFNLRSSLKNAKLIGLQGTKVVRVATKFDKKFRLKAEVKTNNIYVIGNYTMNGQILVLPIKGFGKTNMSLTDTSTIVDMRGDFLERNGETFINITKFTTRMSPRHSSYYFENIFNGDPVLSETILNFMNENSELVSNTLLPGYEEALSEEFKAIANRIFNNIPMKMIFLE